MLYYEDLQVGDTWSVGNHTVSKDEIIEFGERYDPLPFHTDEEAASNSMFGGLVASGIHTLAVCQRLSTERFYMESSSVAGLGIKEIEYPTPVRPGDTLRVQLEIVAKRPSNKTPDKGIVNVKRVVLNQDDEVVLRMVDVALFGQPDD